MAWAFNVNNAMGNLSSEIGRLFFDWWTLGVSEGILEVLGSGDGLLDFENTGQTAGPAFNVLTSPPGTTWNPGTANSWSNASAWIRLRMVGTTLEFLIKRHTSTSSGYEDDFAIGISQNGFVSGGASATTAPTATDTGWVLGGAAAYASFGPAYATDYYFHIGFNQTATNGFYSFYIFATVASSGVVDGWWIFDSPTEYVTGDDASWVTIQNLSTATYLTIASSVAGWSYRDFGGASELLSNVYHGTYFVNTSLNICFPNACPPQIADSKTRTAPVVLMSYTLGIYKGVSDVMRWNGVSSRNYPDTIDRATADARVYLNHINIPWEQGTTPL